MDTPLVDDPLPGGDLPSTACDSEAARLLPWHVTGRLAAADAARVAQHLGQCATCRADFESQRVLRERLRDDGPLEYAPQAGLAATLARIDELGRELSAPARTRSALADAAAPDPARRRMRLHTPHWRAPQWLAAAVVVQAIGLGVTGSLLLARSAAQPPASQLAAGPATAGYETLSMPAADAPPGQLRAVFAADMTLGQLADLLGARGLQVVSGPTEAGVYTLGAGPGSHEAVATALRALRADPRVRFAEPTRLAEPGRVAGPAAASQARP